ncbi:MAG TPA: hypothetical protein PL091_12370 [Actinomycetota bacterium]|nr:hypothetical protein [Actinomycetota bacterium]
MTILTHPDSKQSIEVDEEQVPMYLTQGWTVKDSAKKAADKK